jgi:flagellar basal-body rod modification protein FlgD
MNIQNVLSVNTQPRAADTSTATSSTNSASASAPSNLLNANSFITLLTAQLQAQDPLNPLDPNQMMDELVSMNSLQQLIGIKQDLDNLGGANPPSTTPGAGSAPTGTAGSVLPAQAQVAAPSPSYHDAILQQKFFPAQPPASL